MDAVLVAPPAGRGSPTSARGAAASRSRSRSSGRTSRSYALDASTEALEVARENAARHGVEGGSTFDRSATSPSCLTSAWNARRRRLEPAVRDRGRVGGLSLPRCATTSRSRRSCPGPTGNEAYAALAPQAFRALRPGGLLALELGWTSEAGRAAPLRAAGFEIGRCPARSPGNPACPRSPGGRDDRRRRRAPRSSTR